VPPIALQRSPENVGVTVPRSADLPPLAAEDHVCSPCALSYVELDVAAAVAGIRVVPDAVASAMAAVPGAALRRRPEPAVWSVLEYAAHVRDVYATFLVRLHRARVEDHPTLDPMFGDLRAQRLRYNDLPPDAVLAELALAAQGFCDEVADTRDDEWGRTVRRLPGEDRTALWLVRHAMHEGVHHVRDIERIGALVTGD
jgi:predicted nucleic acid-binding protein